MPKERLAESQKVLLTETGFSLDSCEEVAYEICSENPDVLFLDHRAGLFKDEGLYIDLSGQKVNIQEPRYTAVVTVAGIVLDHGGGCPDQPREDQFKETYSAAINKEKGVLTVTLIDTSSEGGPYPGEYG